MIRGEYVLIENGVETIIPNQFTIFGTQTVMRAAFWQQPPANLWVGLCGHNPADNIILASIQEPSETNGYARVPLDMSEVSWPKIGSVNGESYVESRELIFDLTDAIDVPVNRFFMTDGENVISISSAFRTGLQLYDSPIINKYRLFIR